MNPEILGIIFRKITKEVDEMVRTVPFVCKTWNEVVSGPYCWSEEIDVSCWCRRQNDSDKVDTVVKKLLRRSKCTVNRFCSYRLGESGFFYVAHCGRYLKELHMPMSDINDEMVLKHIKPLPNLITLDISFCFDITSKGIAAFGNNCKFLLHLKRNMPQPESFPCTDDSEAETIAKTMPNVQHIELCSGRFSEWGLTEILTKCKSITYLDIYGCWNIEKLNGEHEEICGRLDHFQSPWMDSDDACSESEGSGNELMKSETDSD
ncbi:F-box protein FBW2-like [Rutidosis leptorrhynchoides]|uniref:F-box protein FBW2-like n=1 Tax=Rutidosis leptorrhynchoides TaxID=125765 RepID=UPI003A99BE19